MAKPKTDDEALLARVAKEKPELLEADIDSEAVEQLIGRLIKAPPEPKRQRGKRGITKSRVGTK